MSRARPGSPEIREAALGDVMEALGLVAVEVDGEGRRTLLSPLPGWYPEAWKRDGTGPLENPDQHPFFSNFLIDARRLWASPGPGRVDSGPWLADSGGGSGLHLEALAFKHNSRRLLLLKRLGPAFRQQRDLLQKARGHRLSHERLVREVQHKEILLHCIVHDLAGPLTGISGTLSLLAGESLSEAGRRRLDIGRRATGLLDELIRGILEVFSAEVEEWTGLPQGPTSPPELLACAERVVETLGPAAALREIRIELSLAPGLASPLHLVAEGERLERVLYNLVENAIRHAPDASTIRVAVEDEDDSHLRVQVEDDGPGVAPELRDGLFQKLIRGPGRRGKAGLGLYFCRIMVERWGGRIGYSTGASGGAVFWMVLPRSQP